MNRTEGKSKVWLAIALGCVGIASVLLCILGFYTLLIAPARHTEYAAGYSAKAFRAIAEGDSEERVLDLLGEPLERNPNSQDPSYVYLRYSRGAGPSSRYFSRIILLKDGRVVRKWREVHLD